MECYASCPASFERALATELRGLGVPRVRPLKGRVSFEGSARDAYRVCLWSRLASRVYLVVGRFSCASADDLYDGAYELPWPSILKAGASLAIFAQGTNDALRNTRFSALRVKDAIADRMLADTGARPVVDTHAPDARISLSIRGERASLALDLSGEPLFKRIPRRVLACAPSGVDILRPDYAALLLTEVGWQAACRGMRRGRTGARELRVRMRRREPRGLARCRRLRQSRPWAKARFRKLQARQMPNDPGGNPSPASSTSRAARAACCSRRPPCSRDAPPASLGPAGASRAGRGTTRRSGARSSPKPAPRSATGRSSLVTSWQPTSTTVPAQQRDAWWKPVAGALP